jgi:hypothetical protein
MIVKIKNSRIRHLVGLVIALLTIAALSLIPYGVGSWMCQVGLLGPGPWFLVWFVGLLAICIGVCVLLLASPVLVAVLELIILLFMAVVGIGRALGDLLFGEVIG